MNAETSRRLRAAIAGFALCTIAFAAGRLSVRLEHPPETIPSPPSTIASVNPEKYFPSNPNPRTPRPSSGTIEPTTDRREDSSWLELISQPGTVARNQRLAALLETLARTDPQRALSLAQAEKNLKLREELVHASLRGWGASAAGDAVEWVLALPDENNRDAAIAAVFSGASIQPAMTLATAKKICAEHPGEATGYGNMAIDALCDAGYFSTAIELIAGSDSDAQRSIWTAEAYSRWAALQPEQAAQNAAALTDPERRIEALHGVIGGWAQADPAALTHFVATLPAGGDRGSMIGQALQSWVRLDPEAAAAWINEREISGDYDEGVAAVASVNFVKPALALTWAESISDPRLRSETVAEVLHGWALEDLLSAKHYFAATGNLLPEDRRRVGEIIATAESPTP